MTETWRPISGYEGFYEVSDDGRVRSVDRTVWCKPSDYRPAHHKSYKGSALPQYTSKDGRRSVNLHRNNKHKTVRVCRLVAEAFIGPCPNGMECCHNDGDSQNNVPSNLRWDTRRGNSDDTLRHGTRLRGEKKPTSLLTEIDVRFIRHWLKDGRFSQPQIASSFGVHRSTINNINNGYAWSWFQEGAA